MEWKPIMDKIVIRTDSLERSGRLASYLSIVFPRCEIEVELVDIENHREAREKAAGDSIGTSS